MHGVHLQPVGLKPIKHVWLVEVASRKPVPIWQRLPITGSHCPSWIVWQVTWRLCGCSMEGTKIQAWCCAMAVQHEKGPMLLWIAKNMKTLWLQMRKRLPFWLQRRKLMWRPVPINQTKKIRGSFSYQRKFGRYFRVTKSWGEVRLEGGRKQRWCQLDVMSIRKWQERDVKAVVVKTAQVWRESKIAREMLCFTIETAAGGHEGRRCRTGGCGLCSRYVRAMFARDRNGRRVQSSRKGKQCAAYYWGMPLQIARRLITVGARRRWVAIGARWVQGCAG